jgi:hypothetical protein
VMHAKLTHSEMWGHKHRRVDDGAGAFTLQLKNNEVRCGCGGLTPSFRLELVM